MIRIRKKGRERAFQILFGCDFFKEASFDFAKKMYFHFFFSKKIPEMDKFALELIQGVFVNKDKLDDIIASVAKNWKIYRIAKIELTILRLAIYELLWRADIPTKVAINEGIELSKRYGDVNSRRFINGILDAVAKKYVKTS